MFFWYLILDMYFSDDDPASPPLFSTPSQASKDSVDEPQTPITTEKVPDDHQNYCARPDLQNLQR